jgi:hypothetical protein
MTWTPAGTCAWLSICFFYFSVSFLLLGASQKRESVEGAKVGPFLAHFGPFSTPLFGLGASPPQKKDQNSQKESSLRSLDFCCFIKIKITRR